MNEKNGFYYFLHNDKFWNDFPKFKELLITSEEAFST